MTAPRIITEPQPGWYRVRLVKGGPHVPCLIFRPCPIEMHDDAPWNWCDRWPHLHCLLNGERWADPFQHWPFCQPVNAAEYLYLVAVARYDELVSAATSPSANPFESVRLDDMPPVLPPGFTIETGA